MLARAQNYSIDWHTIGGGGGTSAGGGFALSGTIGQPDAGEMSDGEYTVSGGFWSIEAAVLPPLELRISAAERIGNDLRLSFISESGRNYTVQSRADLGTGEWSDLPGTTSLPGTGATLEVTISNAFTETRRFFRVKQSQ